MGIHAQRDGLDFRDRDGSPTLKVPLNELVHSTHLLDYEFTGRDSRFEKGQDGSTCLLSSTLSDIAL